ncbi:hypothetical protein DERP_011198 [Dermatophagoides pteronyssinus]|uniref:Uncharacterized protein n=1 Tax=Dermatophagoides pteronyssinus TaxID=6956 RepID=A0ABQ8JCG1_DERPT|nr:hypothetical protein DERP_011198 [Dermatophagoides pteronyssinus]
MLLLSAQFSSSIIPSSAIDDNLRFDNEFVRDLDGIDNDSIPLPSISFGTVNNGVFSVTGVIVGEILPPARSPSFNRHIIANDSILNE